ncbi:unnamed protein product [Kuraishia capsulata CBS 1993]|uniref:Ribosome-recycling factor, mitochondrial n=1 Tax=Kuraishia capsulata CBS 1993 TaxID=1382522 RepID=W6MG56_9ASCO|nr:uncharacterized protein KUCA_T00000951001 [Kuraishia capsulata CBS 1993]CDK24984.1 unnamed protein product [Kuraishia capsulata CBS 1993]
MNVLRLSLSRSFSRNLVFSSRTFLQPASLQRSVPFSTSVYARAKASKKSKGGKAAKGKQAKEEPAEEVEFLDPEAIIKAITAEFSATGSAFKEKAAEIQKGRADPKIFDHLNIELDHHETSSFTEVAQTTLRGPKALNVTVFDPANTKRVVSAIIGADLNMNPEVDPLNPQMLKVPLPLVSSEVKEGQAKALKATYENFKNSTTNKQSLSYIRGKALKDVKAAEGTKNILTKLAADIEKLHKKYADDLLKEYKQATQVVLK